MAVKKGSSRDRGGKKSGRADFIGRRTQTEDGVIHGRGVPEVPQGSSSDGEEPIRRSRRSFLGGS